MKKSLFIIAAIALVFSFTSCNKNSSYGGKYTGTYTFFKQNGSISTPDSVKKGKTVPVSQLTDASIQLYYILSLSKVSDGVFQSSEMQADLMKQLLQTIGVGQNASEAITNVKIKADFTQKDHLTYVMTYDVQLLGVATVEVRILQFDGDKQSN
ncbi:MAG: hypothetical protein IKP54_00735 [Bacteroidales bacterium]|jgi:hypothetical protein|nr:hypothetical protein [Bacteroidota bacterium]MBQ9509555.1 hypothetical protein [Bacteroidales bacterium]MBR6062674.1 hypothetical protein [Bacteroidales bacterium]